LADHAKADDKYSAHQGSENLHGSESKPVNKISPGSGTCYGADSEQCYDQAGISDASMHALRDIHAQERRYHGAGSIDEHDNTKQPGFPA